MERASAHYEIGPKLSHTPDRRYNYEIPASGNPHQIPIITKQSYKIMVFSWNTESVGLCETMDTSTAEYNRTSYSSYIPGLTTWKYDCNIPDFYPKFAQLITKNNPDVVVIGFQEDRYPGSYFHSHLLPIEMPKIGYGLVKRTKLMGIGVTTYKGMLRGDLFERGIRVSIYAKNNLVPLIEREEAEMRAVIGNDGQTEYVCSSMVTRGKGATASYVILPGCGRIAFICCHLPFNARSLITERIYKNKMLRQNQVNECNVCFNNIIENLVLFKEPMPTHVIYFGDFNYRVADPRPASIVAYNFITKCNDHEFIHDIYVKYDELREQMRRTNIYEFCEGISNQGPMFVPTCKMIKGRITEPFNDSNEIKFIKSGQCILSDLTQDGRIDPDTIIDSDVITKSQDTFIERDTIFPKKFKACESSFGSFTNYMESENGDTYPHIESFPNILQDMIEIDEEQNISSDLQDPRDISASNCLESVLNRDQSNILYNRNYVLRPHGIASIPKSILNLPSESNNEQNSSIPRKKAKFEPIDDYQGVPVTHMISQGLQPSIRTIDGMNCWNTGSYDQRVPSWCDRILYRKFGDDGHNMICTYYNRFDVGTVMSKSDHAGVIGMFEL